MNFPKLVGKRKLAGLAAAGALALGGFAGAAVAGAGSANAAACDPLTPVVAGTTCDIAGSANLGGNLSLTAPATLTWSGSVLGTSTAFYVDTVAADQIYGVDDETTSGDGWNVAASATTFTNEKGTADTGIVLKTNGCTLDTQTGCATPQTGAVAPTATLTCNGGVPGPNCSLPTNTVTYPVTLTGLTPPATAEVYNAAIGTGEGTMNIGGSTAAHPVGWWITVPASTEAGVYTTTVTIGVSSGP